MATAFTRSTRSLQDTSFYKAIINLSLVLMVIGLWSIWFFFASIALYEISIPLTIRQEEILTANFPLTSQARLQRGQQALIKLDGEQGSEVGAIPALVTQVQPVAEQARVEVTLFAPWLLASELPRQDGVTGWVEIEVEHLSPASIVVRAVNDKLKSPAIQFTPQNNLEAQ